MIYRNSTNSIVYSLHLILISDGDQNKEYIAGITSNTSENKRLENGGNDVIRGNRMVSDVVENDSNEQITVERKEGAPVNVSSLLDVKVIKFK